MAPQIEKNKIESIQVIRGVAALFVVLFHYRQNINNVYVQTNLGDLLFSYGWFGVDLFFLISGFIIYKTTETKKPKLDFIIKRIFRIYPAYLFCLSIFMILFFIIPHVDINVKTLIKSLILIPIDYMNVGPFYGYSILSVAWTLSYEMLFYLIFFISMSISQKYRLEICSFIIIILPLTLQVYFFGTIDILSTSGNSNFINNSTLSNLNFASNPIIFEFIVGMLIGRYYNQIISIVRNKKIISHLLFFVIGVTICYLISGKFTQHGITSHGAGIPSIVIMISFIMLASMKSSLLPKSLINLGAISYSLYLVHIITPFILNAVGITHALSTGVSVLFLNLIASIFFATLIYNYIEIPFMNLARKITNKDKAHQNR